MWLGYQTDKREEKQAGYILIRIIKFKNENGCSQRQKEDGNQGQSLLQSHNKIWRQWSNNKKDKKKKEITNTHIRSQKKKKKWEK